MGSAKNSGTTRQGRYTKLLADLGLKFKNDTIVDSGSLNPTVTAYNAPIGSIYLSSSTGNIYRKLDSGSSTNWKALDNSDYLFEPTGYIDNNNIGISYDVANRTVALTHGSGFVEFLLRGRYYRYASPWTVPTVLGGATPIAHTNANGTYFCKINAATLAITFDVTPFEFSTDLTVAVAFRGSTYQYAQREPHGFMPWQSHQQAHYSQGSYLRTIAVPTAGTYAVLAAGSGTDAANTPGIDTWTQYDEDVTTVQAAWIQGTYTVAYRDGVGGGWVMSTTESFPFMYAGGTNFIKYNLNTAGTWSLADVPEDQYVNILMMAMPATSDVDSQKYRLLCFVGQTTYTTLAGAQAASAANWDFGTLTNDNPEMVPLMMWSYIKNSVVPNPETTTGNARLAAEPTRFFGTSRNLTGIGGIAPTDHQALSNRTAANSHPITAIAPLTASKFILSNAGATALEESTPTVSFTAGVTAITFAAAATQTIASINNAQTWTGLQTFTNNIISPTVYGSAASGGNLEIQSTSHATKGIINFGASGAFGSINANGAWSVLPGTIATTNIATINGVAAIGGNVSGNWGLPTDILINDDTISTAFIYNRIFCGSSTSLGRAAMIMNSIGGYWGVGIGPRIGNLSTFQIGDASPSIGTIAAAYAECEQKAGSNEGGWTLGKSDNTSVHNLRSPKQTTVGAAGGASALPATPTGYVEIKIQGTAYVLPYYAKS